VKALVMLVLSLSTMALAGCGVSLRTHAQVAAISADLIDATGAAIEAEAAEDVDEARAAGIKVDGRLEVLEAAYAPIEQAYAKAVAAHAMYLRAIVDAVERGQNTLEAGPARALLEAWRQVAEAGDGIGVLVPEPPPLLVRIAGEK
jgi:hypothetical protein